jgi:photosystem II stability/assembly factor-like uncharacterized protein
MRLRVTPHSVGLLVLVLVALCPSHVPGHDASMSGGLFRTRDAGATWLPLNPGSFVSGALALAVSPVDTHHLLLATDTGVARSRNGGRDWVAEAPNILVGPAFAVTFDADGERALVSGSSSIFQNDGGRWGRLRSPVGSTPAHVLAAGSLRGRVYLAGPRGLYRSDDWGQSWVDVGGPFRAKSARVVVVSRARPDEVYAVVDGRCWASTDAGRDWQLRVDGLPQGGIEALALDPSDVNLLWSVVADQVFRSDDQGRLWRRVGEPLPERPIVTRALAVMDRVIVTATDRGVYRSIDGGERWTLVSDNLPAHLEAGMLVRDPIDRPIIYAGFALTSHDELARRAVEDGGILGRMTLSRVVRWLPFIALVLLAAGAGVWRLARADLVASRSVLPR